MVVSLSLPEKFPPTRNCIQIRSKYCALPPHPHNISFRNIPINLCTMFNSIDNYQQIPPAGPTYPIPMAYSYGVQSYEARGPREGFSGYSEKERDNRRPSHIFPHKTHRQAPTKRSEEPIDSYFHIQMGYVPVQIVDTDRVRYYQGEDRDQRAREERRRTERREDVTTLRHTCETTDIWRQSAYPNPGQLRDRYPRHTTRVYQTDPGESSKFLVRKQEYVSRVKEIEVYQPRREKAGCDTTTARLGPNEYTWGRGFIRARDA